MTDYIPSDEQVGNLARALAATEADDLVQHPAFQEIIRAAQAAAIRDAAGQAGDGFDLNPTITTLNGQNAFWWYDYLKRQNLHWKSRLESLAKRYEHDDRR